MPTRRLFLQTATAAAALGQATNNRLPIKKAILLGMLPKELSVQDRFQLAKDVGFERMECATAEGQAQADEIKAASVKTGLPIHSVMNADHWKYPLSSSDPEVVAKCQAGMATSLRQAKLWGADTVLLVPAVVDAKTPYQRAYEQSQREIRKMIPLAQQLGIVIGVENVWNKFLLSPLEFARYVDEFNSPYVRAYFDVGNILLYGYPQDWIRTLGPRIVKVHFKDFSFRNDPQTKKRTADFVQLREGELPWKEVHQALREINYQGVVTVELASGDKAYLQDTSRRVDMILAGA